MTYKLKKKKNNLYRSKLTLHSQNQFQEQKLYFQLNGMYIDITQIK